MRSALIGSVAGAFLLLVSTSAYADPPLGVGAAVTASGFVCLVSVLVEPGPNITPQVGPYGVILTPLVENTKWVQTNSANGNVNLTCHGSIEYDAPIIGFDPVNGLVAATLPPFDEACEVLNSAFPGVCTGGGAIVVTSENTGTWCEPDPGLITYDYREVVNSSGRVTLSCQYVAE